MWLFLTDMTIAIWFTQLAKMTILLGSGPTNVFSYIWRTRFVGRDTSAKALHFILTLFWHTFCFYQKKLHHLPFAYCTQPNCVQVLSTVQPWNLQAHRNNLSSLTLFYNSNLDLSWHGQRVWLKRISTRWWISGSVRRPCRPFLSLGHRSKVNISERVRKGSIAFWVKSQSSRQTKGTGLYSLHHEKCIFFNNATL